MLESWVVSGNEGRDDVVAKFGALQLSGRIHALRDQTGHRLPDPIALTIDRNGYVTLVFTRKDEAEQWWAEMADDQECSPPYARSVARNGHLLIDGQEIPAKVVHRHA